MLTKLEEQVLMTVWQLQGAGYGVNIFRHLDAINEKRVTLGVVYDILERLAGSGYLDTRMGDSSPVRGGMKKKFYIITDEGIEEIVKSKYVYEKVMADFEQLYQQYCNRQKALKQNGH